MSRRITLEMNRVEGDLEIEVAVEDGRVSEAWCRGTLYRGFEQLMLGRDPLDALVITPRVCGICSTAHLSAAVLALENALNITPPPAAIAVRNVCLMAETAQSDLRQAFLMFAIDFCRPAYASAPWFAAAEEAFAEGQGTIWHGTLDHSRLLVQVVALFGGQWPHSSHMVPGGVTTPEVSSRALQGLQRIRQVADWVSKTILGGRLEDFLALASQDELQQWLDRHPSSLALLCRAMSAAGLDKVGQGAGLLLSCGGQPIPERWSAVRMLGGRQHPASVFELASGQASPLDEKQISEDITSSWYEDDRAARHPAEGRTAPRHTRGDQRYTWAKAPRYGGQVAQVGALAQLAVAGDPLIRDLLAKEGDSAWLRQFARLRRMARNLVDLQEELAGLARQAQATTYYLPPKAVNGSGFGMIEAARGMLGHWLAFESGRITRYQIISPTSWNASPRDAAGRPGHWEQSLVGLPVDDEDNPLLIGHVIRSHDPCLVCTVHAGRVGEPGKRRRVFAG